MKRSFTDRMLNKTGKSLWEYDDEKMKSFLFGLEEAERDDITEFEQEFMESNRSTRTFTDPQRRVITTMITKYGHKMKDWK